MVWNVTSVTDERFRFVIAAEGGTVSMTALCAEFGISRETGYKWVARYRAGGLAALADGSHVRHALPPGIPDEIATLILTMRRRRPFWGPKKLREVLTREHPDLVWPALSTMGDLLKREGLVKTRHVRARGVEQVRAHVVPDGPNDIWAIDFKGWFRTQDGIKCDPLTVTDLASRYLLMCDIVSPDMDGVWPATQRLFKERGQPRVLRMDNGSPFGSKGAAGLTKLSVLWLKLGIALEPITPGCPGENGQHERMHRTLKAETSTPPAGTAALQQRRFDRFRLDFNEVRPHEALGQATPASVYRTNTRLYAGHLDDPWYDADHSVHRVLARGYMLWADEPLYISEALAGELVGVAPLPSGNRIVRFATTDLGVIVRQTGKFIRFATARPGRTKAVSAWDGSDAETEPQLT